MMFHCLPYEQLNSRQQENFNFQKVAARLADYGFNSMRLSDDFHGADFIAMHADGETLLRVQLKGRLCFDAKYYGKGLHIAFRDGDDIYVYSHDELRQRLIEEGYAEKSTSKAWVDKGSRSWPRIPNKLRPILNEYRL
ncbi:hypothetical protein [Parvularcula marina]|uniref:hypothetical protein n=1 Tax=Parvularcula marina TaxID=2292771 RepID=UPI003513EA88